MNDEGMLKGDVCNRDGCVGIISTQESSWNGFAPRVYEVEPYCRSCGWKIGEDYYND